MEWKWFAGSSGFLRNQLCDNSGRAPIRVAVKQIGVKQPCLLCAHFMYHVHQRNDLVDIGLLKNSVTEIEYVSGSSATAL